MQFFADFSELQEVFNHSESLSIADMVNFIEHPLPFRRMIIKKLVNDPNYEAYSQQIVVNTMSNYPDESDFVIALKSKLDSLGS